MISIEWAIRKKLFRNINHAIWFLMSLWLLVLTITYYFFPNISFIVLLPIAVHSTALIQAIHTVHVKKQESEALSKDCIWYNGLLVFIYLVIFFIAQISYGFSF